MLRLQSIVKPSMTSEPSEPRYAYGDLRSADRAVGKIYSLLTSLAEHQTPILITGESGTGKETLAWTVHGQSQAKGVCAIRCTGLTAPELRERLKDVGGTGSLILLDVGAVGPDSQALLLALAGPKSAYRRGRVVETPSARLICTAGHDLGALVRRGRFRADLYYRLVGAEVWLPPLRKRPADIALLGKAVLGSLPVPRSLTTEAHDLALGYPWPGNIRQLRTVLEAAAAVSRVDELISEKLLGHFLPPVVAEANDISVPLGATLAEAERRVIWATLAAHNRNRQATAAALGISRRTLYEKLHRYGSQGHRNVLLDAEEGSAAS